MSPRDLPDVARPPSDDARLDAARHALLAWYRAHRRDLPWRRAEDPYAVWVSEVMLQQTRVATAVPYYERWMEAFPTVEALAAAPREAVLARWQGLGYYSRARNLHQAAGIVVRDLGGRLPADPDALRALPGIGPYTAGAIASIAYGRRAPAVDGNVRRVLARWQEIEGDVRAGAPARAVEALAAELVAGVDAPADWNQALMELGSEVCAPRRPRCELCPLAETCRARAAGRTAELPARPARRAPREAHAYAWLVRDLAGRYLWARRPDEGLLGGLWEPPLSLAPPEEDPAALARARLGLADAAPERTAPVVHVFSHLRLRLTPLRVPGAAPLDLRPAGEDPAYAARRWLPPAEWGHLPRSALARRIEAAAREAGWV